MAKRTTKKKTRASASVAAQVIAAMERKTGRNVVPATLVREAQNPKHPLHHRFEWDDSIAAHKHRLDIAQKIISSVRVVTTHGTIKISSVGYVRDPTLPPDVAGYVSVARLRTEREHAEETILYEVGQVVAHLERARELAFALDMAAEFDAAWSGAQQLQSRLRKGAARGRAEIRTGASA
jgi:hypothetical protein